MNYLNTLRYAANRQTPFAPHLVCATMTELFTLVGKGYLNIIPKSYDRTHFQITPDGAIEYQRLEDVAYKAAIYASHS